MTILYPKNLNTLDDFPFEVVKHHILSEYSITVDLTEAVWVDNAIVKLVCKWLSEFEYAPKQIENYLDIKVQSFPRVFFKYALEEYGIDPESVLIE